MSKVYIVPTQTPGEDGGLQNVNWVPERNDVFFDYNDGEFGYDHILMTYVDDPDGALYSIDGDISPTSQPIAIGFNPNLQKYVAFTGHGALVGAEISAYYDDEKNYIVPQQKTDSNGVVRNVNWVSGRNDVIATVPGISPDAASMDIPMTFNPDGNGSYYGEVMEGVTLSIGFADGIDAYTAITIRGGEMQAAANVPISLWYPVGHDDPDDPDKKPDNIKDHTASKNQVIEAARPAQVRSQLNWMDRVEEIATDILNFDPLDYRVRSIEKYLDEMDGRHNLDPIIRINKDIEKPEDNSDDNTEDLSANV